MANFSASQTGNGQFNAVFGEIVFGLQGKDGEDGKDFDILGYYDSVSELESAVKSPKPGDAYGVGLAAPYDIYIWDATKNIWKNNGPIGAGSKIDKVESAIAGDFPVLTDDGQLKGSGKKPSDFAPSGYGLGMGYGREIPDNDFNNAIENGWYSCKGGESNGPALGNPQYTTGAFLRVGSGRSDWLKQQTLYLGAAGLQGLVLRRYFHQTLNSWQPWEWLNPPMHPGAEYRTTERWEAKPVYAKRIACGKGPGLDTQISVPHGVGDIGYIVGFSGCMTVGGTQAVTLPYAKTGGVRADLRVDTTNIWIVSENFDFSGYTDTQVWIKYTKKTD